MKKQIKKYPFYFWILLFLIPVFLLIGAEFLLRVLNFGNDLELLTETSIQHQKYYMINSRVAQRYFSGSDIVIPEARNDIFLKQKPPETFRIFCLGGSTTAGWPFLYNGTFPSLIKDRLQENFPARHFEVVNFGISAVNSYSVLDIIQELVHYQPDVFLIYMGHNEFYGALGVASTQTIGQNRKLVKFFLKLRKYRIVSLLRKGIHSLKNLLASPPESAKKKSTLMQQMIGEKLLPYNGEKYQVAIRDFGANLQEIIQHINKHKIPVVVGTVVSNLRDHAPFESVFSSDFRDREQWQQIFQTGAALALKNDYRAALQYFNQAEKLDSLPAKLSFEMAQCYEQLSQFNLAEKYYIRARDFDALRFRASSAINQIIKQVSRQENVPVADLEALFKKHSTNGLIGKNLLLEHLHPNLTGYALIAGGFYRTMRENKIVAQPETETVEKTLSEYLQSAFVTDLEYQIARIRVHDLTSRWPFDESPPVSDSVGSAWEKLLRQVVDKVMHYKLSFNSGCYQLAGFLIEREMHAEAEIYYRALIKIRPMNYYPYIYLGNALFAQNKLKDAEVTYQKSLSLSRDLPFAYAKLGLLYLSREQPQKAETFLEQALSRKNNARDFGRADQINVRYLLALACAQSQKYKKAGSIAETALKMQPDNQKLKTLLQKIELSMRLQRRK